jgi:hypothetical protein
MNLTRQEVGQVAALDRDRVIATGSPSGLKTKVGGDHLELTVPEPKQRQAGRDLLGSRAEPACTANSRRAVMPMAGHRRGTWRR